MIFFYVNSLLRNLKGKENNLKYSLYCEKPAWRSVMKCDYVNTY